MDEKPKVWLKILTVIFLILFLLMFGSIVYQVLEGWNVVDSIYFTAMTLITVGYGDLVPTNPASKIFTVVFALLGVTLFLMTLAVLAEGFFYRHVLHIEEKVERKVERMKEQVDLSVDQKMDTQAKEIQKVVEQKVEKVEEKIDEKSSKKKTRKKI